MAVFNEYNMIFLAALLKQIYILYYIRSLYAEGLSKDNRGKPITTSFF